MTACQNLHFCSSSLNAEIQACMEGVKLALDHSHEGILVEMDHG
jgi:hypothetical protein